MAKVLLTIVIASLAGCGGGASSASTPSPQPATTTKPKAAGPTKTLTVALHPENGGTVQATLTLTIGAASYTLHLEGRSLHPDGSYVVNIHDGTCALEDLTRVRDVGHLVGDGSGNGLLERTYGQAYVGGGIITIHGYNGSGDEFSHIACAELPAG